MDECDLHIAQIDEKISLATSFHRAGRSSSKPGKRKGDQKRDYADMFRIVRSSKQAFTAKLIIKTHKNLIFTATLIAISHSR